MVPIFGHKATHLLNLIESCSAFSGKLLEEKFAELCKCDVKDVPEEETSELMKSSSESEDNDEDVKSDDKVGAKDQTESEQNEFQSKLKKREECIQNEYTEDENDDDVFDWSDNDNDDEDNKSDERNKERETDDGFIRLQSQNDITAKSEKCDDVNLIFVSDQSQKLSSSSLSSSSSSFQVSSERGCNNFTPKSNKSVNYHHTQRERTANIARNNQLSRYFCQDVSQGSRWEGKSEWLRRQDKKREKDRSQSRPYKRTKPSNQREDYCKGNHKRYRSYNRTKLSEEEVIKRDEKREEDLMSFYGITKDQI